VMTGVSIAIKRPALDGGLPRNLDLFFNTVREVSGDGMVRVDMDCGPTLRPNVARKYSMPTRKPLGVLRKGDVTAGWDRARSTRVLFTRVIPVHLLAIDFRAPSSLCERLEPDMVVFIFKRRVLETSEYRATSPNEVVPATA